MPPRAWDQGTQQQTRLTEARLAEHLHKTLGPEPDSGLTARLTARCLRHQKQLRLVHRSVAVQREVEKSPVPLGTASPGPPCWAQACSRCCRVQLQTSGLVQVPTGGRCSSGACRACRCAQPLQLKPDGTDCLSVWETCPFPLDAAASSPISQLDSISPFSGAQIQASTIL